MLAGYNGYADPEMDIDGKLVELKPLPKVHYCSPYKNDMLADPHGKLLYEMARITHSVSIAVGRASKTEVGVAVYTCARINKTNPDIPCSIGLYYSPWYYKFGKDKPPTYRGPEYNEELKLFQDRLNQVKRWIEEKNRHYSSQVKVSILKLDCERFEAKKDDDEWNEGLRSLLDETQIKAQLIFPDARILWYGRGIRWGKKTPYWTGKEMKSSLSCSLYFLPKESLVDDTYRQTCAMADSLGIESVVAYVSLASGYKFKPSGRAYWEKDWDYDPIYSYRMGAKLNMSEYQDKLAADPEYFRSDIIALYPNPFRTEAPAWGKHFIAYVRGATGVSDLTDLY